MPSAVLASAQPTADSGRGYGSADVHEASSPSGRASAISSMCARSQTGQRRFGRSVLSAGVLSFVLIHVLPFGSFQP